MALDRRKLQVFVSSTFTDLLEERQIAVSSILKAGHIPAGMELFSAGDKSQLDVIKKWIDQSDVYMLILGTRYGSLEPDSSIGYTEMEYDYAVSTGKPFFALVMSDAAIDNKLKDTGYQFVEKDNPEKLKAFRAKVLGKMCSIYTNINDIKSYVYESLLDYLDRNDLVGWVRGDKVAEASSLQDRIADLTAENERLKSDLLEVRMIEDDAGIPGKSASDFVEVQSILANCPVNFPAEISNNGKEFLTTVLKLFKLNTSMLISGATLYSYSKDRAKFFEKHVYGPLVTHRLVQVEHRSNGSRFYTMTEKGLDFAAWLDRKNLAAEPTSASKD
ncbi:hypothetical protein sphantq_00170 [Sphingobium sp. AntQ-1]|uniref:DUF4062 domain-containing protein n=1 Tax=Sphingobium sp. AntQ-1 TaxID=2930091 RepID=UPI00234E4A9F|nr:DUF4062 domain-containing protein [Sphingobium sp. AntQ-1]WCP11785.1 hypothetical protein sphantq_00170 [Sphingobium sp. AntQ-1]